MSLSFSGLQKCPGARCKPEVMGRMMLISRGDLLKKNKWHSALSGTNFYIISYYPIYTSTYTPQRGCSPPEFDSKKEAVPHSVGLTG